MRQIGVLADMVGTNLVLDTDGKGYRIMARVGGPMFDEDYCEKDLLQKKVLFAISAFRLKQLIVAHDKREQELLEDYYGGAAPKIVRWTSSTECDFCHEDATQVGTVFVDGKTRHGPWALMCEKCHKKEGYPKMGTGLGQMYSSKTLEKVAG